MVTLKSLVDEQNFTGMSDIYVIRRFFELNDMEEEGMELIYELTQSKIKKLKRKQRIAKEWSSNLPSKYLYENYDLDIADKLHRLELNYLSNGGELSDVWLKWAKENIPNIEQPQIYFIPLLEWLDTKGVRFKGASPMERKTFMDML